MLARAGVTTALDMAGTPTDLVKGMRQAGVGLTLGTVYPLIPGETVGRNTPSRAEIVRICNEQLRKGALGLKILGGHYPLSPEATARAIDICSKATCYIAVHAGTTRAGSNILGLEELLDLEDCKSVHIAHINSYLRGQITHPLEEAWRALSLLSNRQVGFSESYLSRINGARAKCVDGVPTSDVVKTCLSTGGFQPTLSGMESAIEAGWARIHVCVAGETTLAQPGQGLAQWRGQDTDTGVSFPVNPSSSALAIALAKGDHGFIVDAISTDGGAIPRNTIIHQGLRLVQAEALSLEEFVTKTSVAPARWLGLPRKGHLGIGADADVTVVDLERASPIATVAQGRVVFSEGRVTGSGGALLTTEAGVSQLQEEGIPYQLIGNWGG